MLLEDLWETALRAGEPIARRFGNASQESTRKSDHSPLTEADLESDAILHAALATLLPGSAILSEERADSPERLRTRAVWIIDPLDGTHEFVAGVPELAVSIGLVIEGRLEAGCVYNPVLRQGGVAVRGAEPRFFGLERSTEPAPERLSDAIAIVSRSETLSGLIDAHRGLFRACRPVGSVAYKMLRIAAGCEDLTFSMAPKSEWDVCGGAALLELSGAAYRRLDGAPLTFNQPVPRILSATVAGSPALVEEFLAQASR